MIVVGRLIPRFVLPVREIINDVFFTVFLRFDFYYIVIRARILYGFRKNIINEVGFSKNQAFVS